MHNFFIQIRIESYLVKLGIATGIDLLAGYSNFDRTIDCCISLASISQLLIQTCRQKVLNQPEESMLEGLHWKSIIQPTEFVGHSDISDLISDFADPPISPASMPIFPILPITSRRFLSIACAD